MHPKNTPARYLITLAMALLLLQACQKNESLSTALPAMKVALGKDIFTDKNLSTPGGLACSSCHATATAFSDPNHSIVSEGAVDGLYGNRNAPMAAYASFNPPFHYSAPDSGYAGGLFLDGRANTLEEQAQKPFLNPLEMANPDVATIFLKLQSASYYSLFTQVYPHVLDANTAFADMADAIASYERSPELNPFTSKFDYYLAGQAALTAEELSGYNLFSDTTRAKCANCHLVTPDGASGKILFTDFTYNNDGVPKNPNNPYYTIPTAFNQLGSNYIDYGLGSILNDPTLNGQFRVSSLRNVALTAPYFHNGVYNTLEEVVHFYNVRDAPGSGIAPPEVAANIDTAETGNQHLTAQEEADIVAFLKTLTDGYK
jgi:cytochrome c peroxidase